MAKSKEFKVGDVVILKSGGPPMTISESPSRLGDSYIQCHWFDPKDHSRTKLETFLKSTLKEYDEKIT